MDNKYSSGPTAIDFWLKSVFGYRKWDYKILELLRNEIPPLLSWIVRGGCAVQCNHCIFPFEGPKTYLQEQNAETILSILQQLSGIRMLVHEGRQLLLSQIPILAAIKQAGFKISLINNGQYATPAILSLCEKENLLVDTLDVSIDGTPTVHNKQRGSKQAYKWAIQGIDHAHRILAPKGRLTSLYTITSLNHSVISEVGETVTSLVDEWHLTTMSLRSGIEHMRAQKQHLEVALCQLLNNDWSKPVFLRTYSLEDFVWLLEILGKDTARGALRKAQVTYNALVLDIGIPLYFYPKSLQINETVALDADGWWRMPFCIHYTLDELWAGVDREGNDISHFNISSVSTQLDLATQHSLAAEKWWQSIGKDCFEAECKVLQRILQ